MLPLLFNQVYYALTPVVLDIEVIEFFSVCLGQAAVTFFLHFHFNYKNVAAL